MKEGRTRKENQIAHDFILVLLILFGGYLFAQHDWGSGEDFTTPGPSSTSIPAYDAPRNAGAAKIYTITINGRTYSESASISPTVPIMARFDHPNPAVTQIKMQHPHNKDLFIYWPLNHEVYIQNHSDYMLRGQYSSSKFIAIDEQGRAYDEILIEFDPRGP